MAFTMNDFIRYAKKAFKFYKVTAFALSRDSELECMLNVISSIEMAETAESAARRSPAARRAATVD